MVNIPEVDRRTVAPDEYPVEPNPLKSEQPMTVEAEMVEQRASEGRCVSCGTKFKTVRNARFLGGRVGHERYLCEDCK